jgi:uridine kinase
MSDRAVVLGLSGIPGAGKTTLTLQLRRHFAQARVVYYDRYQPLTRMSEAEVRDWFNRGGDPNEFDHSELVDELRRETRIQPGMPPSSPVVFETPFGRLHRSTGAFIDFLVWIDTPLDIALSRAILAFTCEALRDKTPNGASNFIKWQRQYMTNYPLVRSMYLAQREKIAPTADLVLDGNHTPEVLAEHIRAALAARGLVT